MGSGRGDSKKSKVTSSCATCGAKILPKAIFCFECGPPLPLGKEPEEVGMSLYQALFRISGVVVLFMGVLFIKLDGSFNGLFSPNKGEEGASIEDKKVQDNSFETIHTVIPSAVNIRSKNNFKDMVRQREPPNGI